MTSAQFNYFYKVEITCAKIVIGGVVSGTTGVREIETKTYSFVNKFLQDSTDATQRESSFPILKSIGEVTVSSGDVLPTVSLSQVTIDNSRGSFGANRKFSDVLERYTVIKQPINFYFAETSNDSDNPTTWVKVASGTIQSWQTAINDESPSITFSITPYKLDEKTMSLEVSRDIIGMENAPDASLGRSLPIVFNKTNVLSNVPETYPEVLPTKISADGSEDCTYALATHMYHLTQAKTIPCVFALKSWDSGSTPYAKVYTNVSTPNYLTPLGNTYYSIRTYESVAYKIPDNEETAMLVTGVRLKALGEGSSGRQSGGYLSVFILLVNSLTRSVQAELARGRVALANYDTWNNVPGSEFEINVAFNNPVVIEPGINLDYDFYLGWESTDVTPGDLALQKYVPATPTTYKVLRKDASNTGSSQNDWAIGSDIRIPAHKFLVPTYAFSNHVETYNKDGLTYSKLTMTQANPDTGQTNPALDAVKLVVPMEGMYTYSQTPEAIYIPPELIEIASYGWDGEKWVNNQLVDVSSLATSHYAIVFYDTSVSVLSGPSHRARWISGIFDSKTTYAQFVTEVCRGSACRIGAFSNGKIFVYPWGVHATPIYDIPQDDIIPLNWDVRDEATIVNRAQLTAEKTYAIKEQSQDSQGYVISVDYSAENYPAIKTYTEQSYSLFGTKNIQEGTFNVFGFNDKTVGIGLPGYMTGGPSNSQVTDGSDVIYSIDFLAEYYLARFGMPLTYCSFVVPYHRYKNLKMFDVITFSHTEFPAFYGTDPDQPFGVAENGTNVVRLPNANSEYEFIRARTYRGLVESISFVMAMEHAPALRLTVQVLLNSNFDPT